MPDAPPSRIGMHPPSADAGPPLPRVLVIDDHKDSCDSLAELLKRMGCEVCVAYDGRTGLDAASDFRPDLVLCDLVLPGIDGLDVARGIRALPGGDRVRIVAVSGRGAAEMAEACRDAGFDRYVTKPLSVAKLRRHLAA